MASRRATLFEPAPALSAERGRILIVDDHPLVREGLAARIGAHPDLQLCGEASAVDEALALVRSRRPDLVIVDLALKHGSGLDLIKALTGTGTHPKILVVSAYEEALFAERALRAGALGYLHKQELQGSVIQAIRAVLRGELYVSPALAQRLVGRAVSTPPDQGAGHATGAEGVERLSDRELQIFELIGRGRSTRAIAAQLRRSIHTIESHREKIRTKLGLRNGTELLQRATHWVIEHGR